MQRHIHYSIHLSTSPKIPFGATSVPAMGWEDALLCPAAGQHPRGAHGNGQEEQNSPGHVWCLGGAGLPRCKPRDSSDGEAQSHPRHAAEKKSSKILFSFLPNKWVRGRSSHRISSISLSRGLTQTSSPVGYPQQLQGSHQPAVTTQLFLLSRSQVQSIQTSSSRDTQGSGELHFYASSPHFDSSPPAPLLAAIPRRQPQNNAALGFFFSPVLFSQL